MGRQAVWLMLLTSVAICSEQVPVFDQYPVSEKWTGPAAAVRIVSPRERMFHTRLRLAAKGPPNFAGHFRFTVWGCGSNCVSGAMVDLSNGMVYPSPFGTRPGDPAWNVCQSAFDEDVVSYRVNSRLFVIKCGKTWIERLQKNLPDVFYFVWRNGSFREVAHVRPSDSVR